MSATPQDPEAQEPERDGRDREQQQERQEQEQRDRDRTRTRLDLLDALLRTYTAREVEVARESIRLGGGLGNAALRTFRVLLGEGQKIDLTTAGNLVRAVAQADGAYEQRAYPEAEIAEGLRVAAHVMAKAGTLTPEEWQEATERISKAGVSASDLQNPVEPAPTRTPTSRRVLGRGLAEIEQALYEDTPLDYGHDLLPRFPGLPEGVKIGSTPSKRWAELDAVVGAAPPKKHSPPQGSANFFLQAQNTPPRMGPDEVIYIEGDPISRQRFEDTMAKAQMAARAHGRQDLNALTQRAINEFLGSGAHRTQALRGFLRFLTQEDLATVLGECCARIDDEHMREVMRMLAPEDLQAVNFAAGEEIGTRMIDAEVPEDYSTIRPLEPYERREEREELEAEGILEVSDGPDGNLLLEKDVQRALNLLDDSTGRPDGSYRDEDAFARALEGETGWNSLYAGEVATEAWMRYYGQEKVK